MSREDDRGVEMSGTLALRPAGPLAPHEYSREQVELLKRTVCRGATDDEFALFVGQCNRTGLDPFSGQIRGLKRRTRDDSAPNGWREEIVSQVGIDGYRLIAARNPEYQGQTPPQWCGLDAVWCDVWLAEQPPAAARVGVYRSGCREPFWGVARFASYAQKNASNQLTKFWRDMGAEQLAKCAEALALRKAFPQDLAGIYTHEEMSQADNPEPPRAAPGPKPLPTHCPYRRGDWAGKPIVDIPTDTLRGMLDYERQGQRGEPGPWHRAIEAELARRESAVDAEVVAEPGA